MHYAVANRSKALRLAMDVQRPLYREHRSVLRREEVASYIRPVEDGVIFLLRRAPRCGNDHCVYFV